MTNYEFQLTPAFCLYNGAAVLEQRGAYLKVLIDNENEDIRGRLERAFANHVEYVLKRKDCPVEFNSFPKVEFVLGSRSDLRKCVSNLYEKKKEVIKNVGNQNLEAKVNLKSWELASEVSVDVNKNEDAAAVLLLDSILLKAREGNATDVHIECNKIRMRVNGRLEFLMELEKDRCDELIQRIKLLADMNVLEKRKSQDGQFVYGRENPILLIA